MEYYVISFIEQLADRLSTIYSTRIEQCQVGWWLVEKLTEKTEAQLIAQEIIDLSYVQEKQLNDWINQHIKEKKPLQYILGTVPFLDITITVKPPVLIPRPETEEWVFNLIQKLQQLHDKKLTILDIGTGSGCIALSLAKFLPEATVYAVDISEQALKLAYENSIRNNISNTKLILSDIYSQLPKNIFFDLIVSNPPYIAPYEWKTLSPDVTEWEDKQALVAQQEGLAIIIKIVAGAKKNLKKNMEMQEKNIPQLIVEIGHTQAEAVSKLMEQADFKIISTQKDLSGKDRIVTGRLT